MPDPRLREIFLDGRVHIECPRFMSDEELAVILETFVQQVQARPRKESVNRVEPPPPSRLPNKMKPPKGDSWTGVDTVHETPAQDGAEGPLSKRVMGGPRLAASRDDSAALCEQVQTGWN